MYQYLLIYKNKKEFYKESQCVRKAPATKPESLVPGVCSVGEESQPVQTVL